MIVAIVTFLGSFELFVFFTQWNALCSEFYTILLKETLMSLDLPLQSLKKKKNYLNSVSPEDDDHNYLK